MEFITSEGKAIGLVAVPPLLIDEVRLRAMEAIPAIPIPTYKVEMPDGTFLDYAHDEGSIAESSAEEQAAWKRYRETEAKRAAAASTKVMELFMARGTILPEISEDWKELQAYFGIKLPDNPIALKIHYLRTELLVTVEDVYGLMAAITEASGIDKTLVEAARNSFRSNLRQEKNTAEGTDRTEATGQENSSLVHFDAIPRDGSGEGLEPDPLTVGWPEYA
jgi:hypothetical protein